VYMNAFTVCYPVSHAYHALDALAAAGAGGRGLTALVFPEWTEKDQRAAVRVIFERFGAVVEISEKRTLRAASRVGAYCGGACAGGRGAGLAQGAADTSGVSGRGATPGGIAVTTASAMDRAGYRRSILSGLRAGIRRARALSGGPAGRRGKK
jgi:pyrroline-5-carboxylate reductase